ncbi:hypothetical protein [Thermodesulfovibrio yellowstonii]|uniref:hypothetical protein n=1 Tax=Thermodesulfovibrio yellowstonii TaxID=28262 RepID=UPI0024B33FBD|nr:hypothetical protein [Thermodesulfovibrio yellowstonii]MDI6865789.1 hypothetical protein [Thermodesulfovibrio yellowstonii]
MVKVCIFRERKHGAWFCSRSKVHCGARKFAACVIKDVATMIWSKGGGVKCLQSQ